MLVDCCLTLAAQFYVPYNNTLNDNFFLLLFVWV